MRTGSWLRTLVALAVVFSLVGALPARAIDVTVSATVPSPTPPEGPPTAVVLKGIAYPSSMVTVKNNGVAAAVVPADPQARFEISVGSLTAGTYTFSVFATDVVSRQSPTLSFTFTINTGTTVTISGIFIGPTIAVDRTSLTMGETVTVFGATSPSSNVVVYVASDVERQYTTKAGTDGLWTRQLFADDLQVGTHNARSKAEDPDGSISAYSDTVIFTVASGVVFNKADLNLDGKVDIVDFSILLFYWGQRNAPHPRVDINKDGIVSIVDFSIMLYYWTGQK